MLLLLLIVGVGFGRNGKLIPVGVPFMPLLLLMLLL